MTNTNMNSIHISPRVTWICLTAAIGGLLFGFDTAVISGTIESVKTQFTLSVAAEGWFVSCGLLGCIIGVILTSLITDKLGRKKVMILSGVMFLLSGFGCAFAPGLDWLIASRLIGGIGVGMASVIAPMYIAEFAPASARGRMIAYYQLAITVGILLAYLSNAVLAAFAQKEIQSAFLQWFVGRETWRSMFFMMSIPSLVFILLLVKIPESPRWLFSVNRPQQAEEILVAVTGAEAAAKELEGIKSVAASRNGSRRSVFEKAMRLPLLIGIVLAILQQFSGINAIIYYGPKIFESAGIGRGNALIFQVIIGVINLLFTFVAIRNADRYGRRFLLLTGLTGIVLSLTGCGILFYTGNTSGFALLGLIILFIACFALSLGPVTWIIINEIFPTELRSRAVAICTFSLWGAVWVVGQLFPWLLEKAGAAVTFWLFASFSIINFLFSWRIVKETKNKTLEEVEQLFVAPH